MRIRCFLCFVGIVALFVAAAGNSQTVAVASSPVFRAGAAAADLEADDAMVIGGGIGPNFVKGQEGKLRAVAVVLEKPDLKQKVAVVALDILMINRDFLDPAC